MLIELVLRPESKKAHVKFLINEVWKDKHLDISASNITVEQLIDKKAEKLIEICLKLGMPLTKKDMTVAIRELPIREQEVFEQLTLNFEHSQADLDFLCKQAISSRKIPFIVMLIQLGASLPSATIYAATIKDTLMTVLEGKDFLAARALIEKFTKAITNCFDLISLMDSNIIMCPELIKMLIEKGLNPNYNRGRKTPVSVVMSNQYLDWPKRIGIVCLLLKCGEDCYHLSLTNTSATPPLYVATEKALETGNLYGSVCHDYNNLIIPQRKVTISPSPNSASTS